MEKVATPFIQYITLLSLKNLRRYSSMPMLALLGSVFGFSDSIYPHQWASGSKSMFIEKFVAFSGSNIGKLKFSIRKPTHETNRCFPEGV